MGAASSFKKKSVFIFSYFYVRFVNFESIHTFQMQVEAARDKSCLIMGMIHARIMPSVFCVCGLCACVVLRISNYVRKPVRNGGNLFEAGFVQGVDCIAATIT